MITDVLLSVVVSARNQVAEVEYFIPAIAQFLDANFKNYEVIIVDDGSTDETSPRVKAFASQQKNIRLLRLARHYGSGTALAAGLQHAIGDYVLVMPLNAPMEAIPKLLARCQTGFDAVFATAPDDTPHGICERLTHWLGYISRLPVHPAASNFTIIHRKALNALLELKDRMHNIQVLATYLGIRVDYLPVLPASYSPPRPWQNLLNVFESMLAYSHWPLWWLGVGLMAFSLIGFIAAVIGWILSGFLNMTAFIALIASCLFLLTNGIFLILAGAVGRILIETKHQPLYYIAEEISSRTVEIASIVRKT